MPSTYHRFELAERIEHLSARLYAVLAEAFREDAEARALFLRLANEEEQHATRVRLLAAHYRHDPRIAVELERSELEACAAEVGRALAEVEAGAWPSDVAEVRRRLAALETGLGRAHAELIARSATPELRDFFVALAAQDEAHARLLEGGSPPAEPRRR